MPATPFIGFISLFGLDFAPRDWALCNGQILDISGNTALYSLIGNLYGGDGRTQVALPDLQGRAVVGSGQGPGLSTYTLGSTGGAESVALSVAEIPSHNHSVTIPITQNTTPNANSGYIEDPGDTNFFSTTGNANPMLGPAITNTGSGQPHENRQPYLALNYCIALQGVYPSRS